MAETHRGNRLTLQIVVAIILAVVLALLIPTIARFVVDAGYVLTPLRLGGEIFMRVLKMLVVPLVVASAMTGILGIGDVRKLGKPGLMTIAFYLSTTFLAVFLGLALVNLINPGRGAVNEERLEAIRAAQDSQKGVLYEHLSRETGISDRKIAEILGDSEYPEKKTPELSQVLENLVLMMFTDNLFRAAANMELLPLIIFSIVFAGVLTTLGSRAGVIIDFTKQMNDALLTLVLLVMRFAPLGIFCLVAARFGQANEQGELINELRRTAGYSLTVLLGLGLHTGVTLPLILYVFTGRNPYRFLLQMSKALLTAFATSSSSATLPVTMEAAIDEAGVSRKSVDFVLPLGATINMDGTALYEAVAVVFIAQAIGMELTFGQNLIIAVTAALAAIGAAGIPQAGLVTMIIVLTSVGIPAEYLSLILAVDWLVDRFRTITNVFGDACGAAVVERAFPPESP